MADLNKAYTWAVNTCNADNIGYSQNYRNQKTVNGITYYDCSSFIWYALKAGGFDVTTAYQTAMGFAYTDNAITTAYEKTWLEALDFSAVDINGEWKAGDVLWRSGHTEMVYTGGTASGVTMGAHSANVTLANQVSINSSPSTASSWTSLYRYGDGGAGKYGYSIYVVSALCGNAWRESTINSGLNQVGGSAYGMFQWDGSRKTSLLSWLSDNGYSEDSPQGQLEYLVYENDWINNYGEFSTLEEFLNSDSTDIAYLTECFMKNWERPGVEKLEERIERANQCYAYILAHANDSSINSWYISDSYLTEAQSLNNAVMMYNYYSTGGGGGSFKRASMPIWMMLKPW